MIIIKLRGYRKQEDLAKLRNGYIRQLDEGILVVDDRVDYIFVCETEEISVVAPLIK